MSGVTTSAQQRRIGERDSLRDLIVNNDDICFQHILPRLNQTDLKFLYDVNTETRKLIKRSSRAEDLKKKFWIKEMSSISTLEVAWEHYPWGTYTPGEGDFLDEPYFRWQVAQTNKLELLKWAREEKKCEWDEWTIDAGACQGNLEMVKYCVANECPIDALACVCCLRRSRSKKNKKAGLRFEPQKHQPLFSRVFTYSFQGRRRATNP